jgi:hypothetical protein
LEHKGKGMYCRLPDRHRKINGLLCKVIPLVESLSDSYAKKLGNARRSRESKRAEPVQPQIIL